MLWLSISTLRFLPFYYILGANLVSVLHWDLSVVNFDQTLFANKKIMEVWIMLQLTVMDAAISDALWRHTAYLSMHNLKKNTQLNNRRRISENVFYP